MFGNDDKPIFQSVFEEKSKQESPFTSGVNAAYNDSSHFAGMLNVRAKRHGRFSLIDRIRGFESRSLDADGGEISLAESYADKYLDQRFMGGIHNVGLSDIYKDKKLYAAHFGLDTDGFIDAKDPNKGVDPFREMKMDLPKGKSPEPNAVESPLRENKNDSLQRKNQSLFKQTPPHPFSSQIDPQKQTPQSILSADPSAKTTKDLFAIGVAKEVRPLSMGNKKKNDTANFTFAGWTTPPSPIYGDDKVGAGAEAVKKPVKREEGESIDSVIASQEIPQRQIPVESGKPAKTSSSIEDAHVLYGDENKGLPIHSAAAVGGTETSSTSSGVRNEQKNDAFAKDTAQKAEKDEDVSVGIEEAIAAANEWKEGASFSSREEEDAEDEEIAPMTDIRTALSANFETYGKNAAKKESEGQSGLKKSASGKKESGNDSQKAATTGKIKSDAINKVTKDDQEDGDACKNFDAKRREQNRLKKNFKEFPDNLKSFEMVEEEEEKSIESMSLAEIEEEMEMLKKEEKTAEKFTGISETKKERIEMLEKEWIKKKVFGES